MSVGFPQERQGQPCVGVGGVSHLSLDTPRCVSCISRKHRQVSWHCVVFSRWRARCVCGACEVSLTSCSSATDDRFFFFSLILTGLSRSVGCAFFGIAHVVERQVLLVLAPLRALRIHRRVFARVIQEYMDTWDSAVFLKLHLGWRDVLCVVPSTCCKFAEFQAR